MVASIPATRSVLDLCTSEEGLHPATVPPRAALSADRAAVDAVPLDVVPFDVLPLLSFTGQGDDDSQAELLLLHLENADL